jgi:hypothetical protein
MNGKTIAGASAAVLAVTLTACSGQAAVPKATPKHHAAPVATVNANPFANWSSTCITLADELQSSPYDFSYTNSGSALNWTAPSALTYGQLANLGGGSHGNKNDLSHLSYLAESVDGSSQLANDLSAAGMATVSPADGIIPQTVNGVSIYNNSAYDQLQGEQVPVSNLSGWVNSYLMPVLNDCSAGD